MSAPWDFAKWPDGMPHIEFPCRVIDLWDTPAGTLYATLIDGRIYEIEEVLPGRFRGRYRTRLASRSGGNDA